MAGGQDQQNRHGGHIRKGQKEKGVKPVGMAAFVVKIHGHVFSEIEDTDHQVAQETHRVQKEAGFIAKEGKGATAQQRNNQ
ncbi:hypothetical protein D9M70_594660 [compost metagenome]